MENLLFIMWLMPIISTVSPFLIFIELDIYFGAMLL